MWALILMVFLAVGAFAQSPIGALNAGEFSGADICAKIDAAYAALPAAGGTIFVPPAAGGSAYQCATPVSISTPGKYVLIEGAGHSTSIQWSQTTGTMFSFDAGGAACCNFAYGQWGLKDVTLFGPGGDGLGNCSLSSSGDSVAIALGGSAGAQGLVMAGVDLGCFGVDLSFGENTWGVDVRDCLIGESEHIVEFQPGLTNAGESIRFSDSFFVNNIQNGSSTCQLDLNGEYFNATFVGDSFDGVQVCTDEGLNVFLMPHFEDVAGNVAVPFLNNSSAPGTTLIAPQFSNTSGGAMTPSAFVENSGTLSVWGWNSASADAVSSCIDQVGSGATLDSYAPDAIVPGCDTWVGGGGAYYAESSPGLFATFPMAIPVNRPPRRLFGPAGSGPGVHRPRARILVPVGRRSLLAVLRAGDGRGFSWVPGQNIVVTGVRAALGPRKDGCVGGGMVWMATANGRTSASVPVLGDHTWRVRIPLRAGVGVSLSVRGIAGSCQVAVKLYYRGSVAPVAR